MPQRHHRSLSTEVHPDDRALSNGSKWSFTGERREYNYRTFFGQVHKYIESVAHPIRTARPVIEFCGTVIDVTERKRAEENIGKAKGSLGS